MRISFCIYRLISFQNKDYNYQIWAIGARCGLLSVILLDAGSHSLALFSLLMTAFRSRNQIFIKNCTLLWTITGYRPHHSFYRPMYKKVTLKCTHESGHVKSPNPNSWTKKLPHLLSSLNLIRRQSESFCNRSCLI